MDGVILFHGIARTRYSLRGMARYLRGKGFLVECIGYPSTRKDMRGIAEEINPAVQAFASRITGRLHLVGFSMGGLVVRTYLDAFRPEKLGRVVMIGTPNQGSEVADFFKNWRLFRLMYGPAGQQLTTDCQNIPHISDCEVGIIAGNYSIDPLGSYIIGGENDGKVSVESTRLTGMKAHVVMPFSHTFLPLKAAVWRFVECFLRQGNFPA